MTVVRYSNEVLIPLIIYQKFNIPGTSVRIFVHDERPDLLDFLPNIKGFFLTIGLQNPHHPCRLAYSKCLCTSVFLHMAGKILIYALMFIYDEAEANVVLILSIFVGLFVRFLIIAIFGGARYV